MKTIFYSKDAQFILTDEEYAKALSFWDNGQKSFITRLNVSLSPLYIWAGEKPEEIDPNHRKIDGGRCWATRKFGVWYDDYSGAKLDMKIYGYLNEPEKDENLQLENKNYEIDQGVV